MINSISQASPFFTDVRSIFLPFPPSPRLAVHRGKSIRCYREARLERFTKKVAIASGLISIHPIRTGAKSIGGRRLCALSSPPLSRLSIRSSLFTLLSSYIYIYLHCSSLVAVFPLLSPSSSSRSLRRSRFIHVDRR